MFANVFFQKQYFAGEFFPPNEEGEVITVTQLPGVIILPAPGRLMVKT